MLVDQHETTIYAPVTVVWNLLTDIDEWPRWQLQVKSSKLEQPLAIGARFRWKSHGWRMRSEVHTLKVNERLAWTGRAIGAQANHLWILNPKHRGVQVQTREEISGWAERLFRQKMQTTLKSSLHFWLTSLKAEAERISDSYQSVM